MKTVLLEYRGWIILYDHGFPSGNYCLFNTEKTMKWREKQELPSSNVAYCSNIENALTRLFHQLIVENCKGKNYKPNLKRLSTVINETKQEFKELLTPEILKELK